MTDWTWDLVLVSDPEGGRTAGGGFDGLAGNAEKITEVLASLSRVPWEGEAADAFRDYLSGLAKSARGAQTIAERSSSESQDAAAGLDGLRPAAEDTAELLNNFIRRSENIRKDGTDFGEVVELSTMRMEAEAALARVRSQRNELMDRLGSAMSDGIDDLLGYRTPPPPDASGISDPTQRAMVEYLADEVAATQAALGHSERAEELIEQWGNADSDLERRLLLMRAADELSAEELDYLLDSLDPDSLREAIDAGIFGSPSDADQRELFNALARKLDLDSLNGLADLMPDDYWHPDPFKNVPGLGEDFKPDGWNLSWVPLPDAGQEVTAQSINPEDIQQRGLGDCHLQAALYSLASTEEGRQLLADNIDLNDNGTYTVTLYDRDGNPVPVVVTPDTPVARSADGWTSTYDGNQELWVQLYEKALAQTNAELSQQDPLDRAGQNENPGYPGINGGWPQENFSRITGNEPSNMDNSLGPFGVGEHALRQAEQSGAPITVTFNENYGGTADNPEVYGAHVYSVSDIDWSQHPPTVELRNPWGSSHATLTLDELRDSNGYVTVGSV